METSSENKVAQPQFYNKITALNKEGHGSWKVHNKIDYGYAEKTNAVLITAIEFALVACEYPIVFIQANETVVPVAVLGLKPGENLYVSSEGQWDAKYIPAYVRRYPFILAGDAPQKGETQYTVCLDETYAGFNQDSGEALFTESGEESKYLQGVVAFLKDFQSQGMATERFCKTIKKLDILEPMEANLSGMKDHKDLKVAGFMAISLQKLKAKKPLEIAELVKSDEMALIYHHLSSLRNFNALSQKYSGQPEK